jgi:lipopolysaccharide transport system ATP-binding protein
MSDLAIRVHGLGKRYQIGADRRPYRTLRETITDTVMGPLRRLRAGLSADPPADGERAFWALKDVSFEVNRGEVVGIIGRNGAGKSTLLKILSRITEPTEGEVEIAGRVRSLLEVGTGFHPELTGRDNVYLNGAILGMKRTEIDRKFDEIVAFSEIAKFLDTPVKYYSSGMYTRLAFAVAAHLEPEILIVDEVLAVGDLAFQKRCLGKMGDVANEGRTVLFVSHNMAAVNRLCSRGIWLHEGRVQRSGTMTQVVAGYLGDGAELAAQAFFARRPDAVVQYTGIQIADRTGNISQSVPDNQEFHVRLGIEVYRDTQEIYFGLIVRNSEGVNIIFTDSRDVDHSLPSRFQRGQYSLCWTCPPILIPGRYCVGLGIASRNPIEQLDSQEPACFFEVLNNSNMQRTAARPGLVKLNVPWMLERNGNGI